MSGKEETMRLDVEAIRKRCEAATPGPWWQGDTDEEERGDSDCVYHRHEDGDDCRLLGPVVHEEDAAFIAHAREDVPALLAEIDRLRRDREPMPCSHTRGDLWSEMHAKAEPYCTICRLHTEREEAITENEKLEAERDGQRSELASAWGQVDALRAQVAELEAEQDANEKATERELARIEYYEEFIGDLAALAGCEEEWSNMHAHVTCIHDAIDLLEAERDAARAEVEQLRKSFEAERRRADRLTHGEDIESDGICSHQLDADRLREEFAEACAEVEALRARRVADREAVEDALVEMGAPALTVLDILDASSTPLRTPEQVADAVCSKHEDERVRRLVARAVREGRRG